MDIAVVPAAAHQKPWPINQADRDAINQVAR